MHYPDYQHIAQAYDLICLSPHLDDAVLSCAGQLIAARQAGLTYGQCSASQTGDAREAGQHVFRRICAGSASGPASGDAGTGPTSRSAVSSP